MKKQRMIPTFITICIVAILISLLTGCGGWQKPDGTVVGENDGYVWGIDISRYQEGLTEEYFVKLKNANCKFVYIQFGLTNHEATPEKPISDFAEVAYNFAEQCEKNQIHFGFYYLSEATTPLFRQAETSYILSFLKDVEGKNYKYNKLPLMLDHEVAEESQEYINAKIKQLTEHVNALNKFGISPLIYTSRVRYEELNAILGSEQNFWIADYTVIEGTGIAPEKNPELIPEWMTANNNIKIWQYTSDSSILGERFENVTKEDLKQNIRIDRNIMKKEFYNQILTGKITVEKTTLEKASVEKISAEG